jgi:hypothetical protein
VEWSAFERASAPSFRAVGAGKLEDQVRGSGERFRVMLQSDIAVPPPTPISLNFDGPFTFTAGGRSVFECPFSTAAGIYLWTIKQRSDGIHLIHYVGETLWLGKRHREHLIHILGLNYGIFHPEKAQEGVCERLWDGLWRMKGPSGPSKLIEKYQQIHEQVCRYLSIVNIFFAELNTDENLRRHIEGCIGWNLRNKHPEWKVLYPDDNHVGTMADKNRGLLRVTASEAIRGLDSEIPY